MSSEEEEGEEAWPWRGEGVWRLSSKINITLTLGTDCFFTADYKTCMFPERRVPSCGGDPP